MLLAQMVVEYVADVSGLVVGVTAATDAMTTVGTAAADSSGYLATLGDQAFTTGVGFDGMAASADTLAVSMADVDASLGVADEALASVAVSADASVASVGAMTPMLAGTSVAAGDAAVSFDALSIAEGAAATAGDAIEASLAAVGIALAAVTIAAGVVGVVTAKMSGDFEASMTRLVTSAGESHKNIKMIGDGILDMSVQVGTGAQKLGDAMFWVESGGAHGKKALEDLKIAAEGAKAENANLIDVTKTLMFTLNNYSDTGLTAAQAMNILIASAGQGEMSLQDLSSAVSNVMPTAHAFGIHLEDIGAGLATMTNLGDDASSAATHLAMMIKTIEAPSKAGSDALRSIGLSTQQVSDEMRTSLPGALELIVDHLKKKFPEGSTAYNEALKNISGGSKSMQAILETTGTNLDKFKQNIDVVTKAAKDGGTAVNNWADIQGTFNFKVDQTKANLEQMGIKIGQVVLPWLGKALDAFNSPGFQKFADTTGKTLVKVFDDIGKFVTPLAPKFLDIAKNFGKVTDAFQNPAFQKLATEIGGDLKRGLEWLINALASPQFGAFMHIVGVGIAGAILFVIPLIKEISANAIKFAEDIWTRVKGPIEGFMHWWNVAWPGISLLLTAVWDAIKGTIQIAWAIVSGIIKIGLDIMKGDWGAAWEDVKTMLSGVWEGIKTYLSGVIALVKGWFAVAWYTLADTIGKPFTDAWATISGVFDNIRNAIATLTGQANNVTANTSGIMTGIHHFAGGVDNFKGGLAIVGEQGPELVSLPVGASVMNAAKTKGLMSYGGGTGSGGGSNNQQIVIQNHFYVDGKEVTTQVMKRAVKDLRRHGLKK